MGFGGDGLDFDRLGDENQYPEPRKWIQTQRNFVNALKLEKNCFVSFNGVFKDKSCPLIAKF